MLYNIRKRRSIAVQIGDGVEDICRTIGEIIRRGASLPFKTPQTRPGRKNLQCSLENVRVSLEDFYQHRWQGSLAVAESVFLSYDYWRWCLVEGIPWESEPKENSISRQVVRRSMLWVQLESTRSHSVLRG